ncbi:GtrA family protein [Geodermatophilus sp. URMC 63]
MPLLPAVRRRAGTTWRLLLKELSAFGVVGSACFVLDLGLFQLLYAHLGVGAVTAKFSSTVVSMTVAYFAHRHWSFSHRARTGLRREYSLFVVVNGLTLALGLALVALVRYPLGQESALVLQVTNVASTGLGTLIRFLSYRRWVFVAADHPAALSATPSPAPADAAAGPAERAGHQAGVPGRALPGL